MEESIQYIGETLWPREIGHFFIILAFVAALFSAYAFYKKVRSGDETWFKLGKIGYYIHVISILVIIGFIFYIMINKMYEYAYVQRAVFR